MTIGIQIILEMLCNEVQIKKTGFLFIQEIWTQAIYIGGGGGGHTAGWQNPGIGHTSVAGG